MNRILLLLLCVAVSVSLFPSRAFALGDPPERDAYRIVTLFPGGDVLRPGSKSSGYTWYLGFDAGLTYSMFQDGPLNMYFDNRTPANILLPVASTVDDGNGVGWYIGVAADFPASDVVGIVVKLNYHTRAASFEHIQELDNVSYFEETTGTFFLTNVFLKDDVDWTFNYVGLDILARIQLLEESLYLLAGPSLGFLAGNNASVTQNIVGPPDIYWTEYDPIAGISHIDNRVQMLEAEGEVEGFQSMRLDLKLGLGTWIELSEGLYLTPEFTVAYPLIAMVNSSSAEEFLVTTAPTKSSVFSRVVDYDSVNPKFMDSNKDWNAITLFFTVGLRWEMD